jgi:hypothetical protein
MIDLDPASIQRMTFRTLVTEPLAVRLDSKHGWLVDGPLPWRVDPVRARSLLGALARLEAVGVAEENKIPIANYGLDNRRFGAQLEIAGGKVAGDLVVGYADGKGSYFGMVPEKPEIFMVDAKTVDAWVALTRDPRDRRVFPPFLPDKVTRVRVRTDQDDFELRRLSAADWVVTKSQRVDSTYALAPGAVDEMLTQMSALEVAGYPVRQPPASSYEPASLQVLLFDGSTQVSGLDIGTKDPNGIHLFAHAPGEPAVFLLSPAALLQIPWDLEKLKLPEAPAPESAERG